MAYIYKIINNLNGKIYIGKRVRENESDIKNYYGSGIAIKGAIKKYGKENFSKEILEKVEDKTKLGEREQYWIAKLNSQNPDIGYNLSPGGDGGCTKESAKKGAETRKKNGYLHHSEETKTKMSLAHKNQKFSDEHKQNLKLNHHLRVEHVLLRSDFSYQKFKGGYEELCKENGITQIMLKRASEICDFRYGFILLDLVKVEESFNHRYAGISCRNLNVFENPLTGEEMTATSYRIFRQHHLEECSKFEKFPWTVEMLQKKKEYFSKFEELQQKIKNDEDIKSIKEVFYVAYQRQSHK